jgi:hypothetical protein
MGKQEWLTIVPVGHAGVGLVHNPEEESVMFESAQEWDVSQNRRLSTGDVAGLRYQYG